MARKKYLGELGERRAAPKTNDIIERLDDEDRILTLLFDHYGIERRHQSIGRRDDEVHAWMSLAVALAFKHVPALRPPKRSGRPKKWIKEKVLKLCADVKIQTRQGMKELAACTHIAKKEPWPSFIESMRDGDSSSGGKTLHRLLKNYQKESHPAVLKLEEIERERPNSIDEDLCIISERFNWQ